MTFWATESNQLPIFHINLCIFYWYLLYTNINGDMRYGSLHLHPSDSIKKKRSQDFYSSTQSLMIRSHGRCRPCKMYKAISRSYLRKNSTSIKGRAIIAIVALIGR